MTSLDAAQIDEALEAIAQSQQIDPDSSIDYETLDNFCWQGSIKGYADAVLDLCEQAVAAAAQNPYIRDSRGLARALTGDVQGAISDFQFFVDQTADENSKQERKEWIKQLQAGRNPFTPEVLESL